jgi:transcriptional regulator with XRE-family HTH domain
MVVAESNMHRQNEIGRRIRSARLRAGLTLTQVGTHLGITGQQVNKYETGRNTVSALSVLALAELLDVKAGWLLGEADSTGDGPPVSVRRLETRALAAFSRIENSTHQTIAVMALEALASLQQSDKQAAEQSISETASVTSDDNVRSSLTDAAPAR